MDRVHYILDETLSYLLVIKDITKPQGLKPYERRTLAAIRRKVKKPETRTITRVNREIIRINPKSRASINRHTRKIERELRRYAKVVAPISSDEVYKGSIVTYKKTKRVLSRRARLPYTFIRPDEVAIARVNKYQNIFIGDHYKDDVTRQVHNVIKKTIEETRTLSRQQIAARLTKQMPEYVAQKGYFQVVTGQVLNNSRSYSSMRFYTQARIDRYEILAVLDERTSEQCKFMSGQILEVERTLKKYTEYDSARTVDEVKSVNPWIDLSGGILSVAGKVLTPQMTGEDLQGLGLNAPPYHGRCRTTVVPVL